MNKFDPVALQMSNALRDDLAARGFRTGDDREAALRLSEELKASIAAQNAAQTRHERSLIGQLQARRLWPRDDIDWIVVALFLFALIGILGFGYAGYLEATTPIPAVDGP